MKNIPLLLPGRIDQLAPLLARAVQIRHSDHDRFQPANSQRTAARSCKFVGSFFVHVGDLLASFVVADERDV